jgi:hypothetical protein
VLGNFSSQTILETWCLAKISQTCVSLGAPHCPVCTGLCPVPRLPASEPAALGNQSRVATTIHRTVWCASGTPGQRSSMQSTQDTSAWSTVTRSHRTVRCATELFGVPSDQRSTRLNKERDRLCSVQCAPESQVYPWTEGNHNLSNGVPTVPKSLGAIKGPSRRHGARHKHTLSNLQLLDSTTTLSIH